MWWAALRGLCEVYAGLTLLNVPVVSQERRLNLHLQRPNAEAVTDSPTKAFRREEASSLLFSFRNG